MILDLVFVPRMSEHPDVVTPHDVGPVSFEPNSELGVLVSLCECFGQLFFFPLALVFLLVFLG